MEQVSEREVHLEKYKMIALEYLTPELLAHFGEPCKIDITDQQNFRFDEIVMRLVQMVWGREAERQEHQWPANWWEAFKDRWFPKWAKGRWPIRYSKCVLTARELYSKVAMPEREHTIVILKSVYDRAAARVKCPYCGHKNLVQATFCAYCDEMID
jgi:hypothetical protein